MVVTAHEERDGGPPAAVAAPRRIERRRPVPGGRAALGGFLIAVAVVGVYAAHSRATALPSRSFVVAARTLEPGTELRASDLTVVQIASSGDGLRATSLFRDPEHLVGARTVGPIAKGEFVQAGSVVRRDGPPGTHEVSLAIDPARAVAGSLRPGERVHVVATFGVGAEAYSAVVVRGAHVVAVDGRGSGLTDARLLTVTLAVATGDEALAVTHAVDAGKLTLVRAGATDPTGPYRPGAGR